MTIITTQKTGKDAKLTLLLSKIMFWGGLVALFAYSSQPESVELSIAGASVVLSIPVYILGRVIKWWRYS